MIDQEMTEQHGKLFANIMKAIVYARVKRMLLIERTSKKF